MKWKTLSSEKVFNVAFFSLDKESCELPDGRVMPSYYILNFGNWVNVVPVDTDGNIILIKQYRHGSREVHWEIPGGGMNREEDPAVAAQRELREETGYASGKVVRLSENYPNPATQNNKVYTYLALECSYEGSQELDPFEDIEVHKFTQTEARKMLQSGEINHTICVASLYQAFDALNAKK